MKHCIRKVKLHITSHISGNPCISTCYKMSFICQYTMTEFTFLISVPECFFSFSILYIIFFPILFSIIFSKM